MMEKSKGVMATPVTSKFAVWLTPAPSDRRWLSKVILDYATEYNSPVFEPHVTVYSGLYSPEDQLETAMAQAVEPLKPLTLQILGLNYTPDFFKTGFIAFSPSDGLTQLSHQIRDHLHNPMDYVLEPHLSLIYKDIPVEQKRLAMLRFILSISTVTFDTIKVITPSNQEWMDIPQWTETLNYTLSR
jgi:hypothetical protein